MINKEIHYCWFGKKPLPYDVKKCIESWKKYAPDYKIIEWNEDNFDVNSHPFVKTAYEAQAWAFVSDYVRLKVIYENGGIYFDTDVELVRNPDFLLENQCYIGVQQVKHLCTTGLGFGAVKYSSVVHEMLKEYDGITFLDKEKNKIACPYLNDKAIKKYGYQFMDDVWKSEYVTVYPSRYFDPYPSGAGENLRCSDTVSIHHYSASWGNKKQKLKRKIARLVGEQNILTIKKKLGGLHG